MALCRRCRDFDVQCFQRNTFRYRGYPLEAVINSAGSGCSFCSLLLQHLKSSDNGNQHSYLNIALRRKTGEQLAVSPFSADALLLIFRSLYMAISPAWVHFSVRRADHIPWLTGEGLNIRSLGAHVSNSRYSNEVDASDGDTPQIWFQTAADEGTAAYTSRDINGHLFADKSTLSQSNIEAIRKWHGKCSLLHERCNRTLSQCDSIDVELAELPTRCIELRPVCGNEACDKCDLLFILVRTEGKKGKYFILSHRWGRDTFLARTTKDNYENRCTHGVSCDTPDGITPLFYEAGQLAFQLGVRYIWIDSVCIVQDDPADWRRESVKMAQYYQYAWLTIAATHTTEDGRLFRDVTVTDLTRVTRLPYRGVNGEQNGYFYLQGADAKGLANDYINTVGNSELTRRGWVYQERILSRRLLAFSATGMFLQCQTGVPQSVVGDRVQYDLADEEEVDDDDDENKHRYFQERVRRERFFNEMMLGNFTTPSSTVSRWEEIVQRYSGLELTRIDEDRLIALSGVATEFGRRLRRWDNDDTASSDGCANSVNSPYLSYFAGTWLPDVQGLLWEQSQPGTRGRVRGIPTWSWASMATLGLNFESKNVWSGMAVQWATLDTPYRTYPSCELTEMLPIPVTKKKLRPNYGRARHFWPDIEYGDGNLFAMLGVRGILIPVSIHHKFRGREDALVAAKLTDHRSDFGRNMWRRVATPQECQTVTGWASVEHPELQADDECLASNNILALVIETIGGIIEGFGMGNLRERMTAYKVVYIRPLKVYGFEDSFERIGVGRLFGDVIDSQFHSTEMKDVWLV
ncbi:heterokaryon incompatibility protein-domain-containing protein [Xylaria bambusicola]|uniref:heterokaryon incompatibility protein-domain-containing protein n=1 Tax=Xylaria bambusicola TaxID=326684 RepID=UPI0020087905|nr:heterokaryon incompatibility protein-domain-containing protein [Xylaria bambusicola]KAI0518302.1 heterokaryon incompatibility protein-domain-containing protein [Xylaria bambusicola]